MNSKICQKLLLIITFCLCAFGCAQKQPAPIPESPEITKPKVIVVKIPPVRNPKLSNEERHWQMQKFLFPQIEIPKKIPKGLPNDDSLFYIKLGEDKSIKINQSRICNLSEVELLQNKLEEIFRNRAEMGVFEESSNRIVKAVLIIAPDSAKYGEVFSLVEAVENSGADPIVLKIGNLPNTVITPRN